MSLRKQPTIWFLTFAVTASVSYFSATAIRAQGPGGPGCNHSICAIPGEEGYTCYAGAGWNCEASGLNCTQEICDFT